MFYCPICGLRFDEPVIKRYLEPMPDGFCEQRAEEVCPGCGEAYFDEESEDEEEEWL